MKMIVRITSLVVGGILLLGSCRSPLDKEFNRETAEADFLRIVKLKKLDSTEVEVMAHFMVEHDLIGAQILEAGASYRDILEQSKKFWKESGEGNKRLQKTNLIDSLNAIVSVTATPLAATQSPWSNALSYKVKLENKSAQEIKGVKGFFKFYDQFNEPAYEIEFKFLDRLASGASKEDEITFRLANATTDGKFIYFREGNPFRIEWVPMIVK